MSKIILGFIAFLILVVGIGGPIGIYFLFDGNLENASKFGEACGAVASVVSTLALLGVLYTIFLEKEALNEQRLEIANARIRDKQLEEYREQNTLAFSAQIRELGRAAEIQTIKLRLGSIEEEFRGSTNKESLVREKEDLNNRIQELLQN